MPDYLFYQAYDHLLRAVGEDPLEWGISPELLLQETFNAPVEDPIQFPDPVVKPPPASTSVSPSVPTPPVVTTPSVPATGTVAPSPTTSSSPATTAPPLPVPVSNLPVPVTPSPVSVPAPVSPPAASHGFSNPPGGFNTQEVQTLPLGTQFQQALQSQGIDPFGSAGQLFSDDTFQPASTVFLASAPNFQGNNPFSQFLASADLNTLPAQGLDLFGQILNSPSAAQQVFTDPTLGSDAAFVLGNLAELGLAANTNRNFADVFGNQLTDRIAEQFALELATNPTSAGTLAQAFNTRLGLNL